MSYPYRYTYPENTDSVGYKGPMNIQISADKFINGIVEAEDSRSLIRASIQKILLTFPGERAMQPEFGIGLNRLLFEQNDKKTLDDIYEIICNDLPRQEPRIIITGVEIIPNYDKYEIHTLINFKYKNTMIEDSLDFRILGNR